MKNTYTFILLTLAFLVNALVHAQPIVTTSLPPYDNDAYLVNSVLMGSGVSGYNITGYGQNIQKGYFSSGMAAIGLDSGLVMCSGNVTNIMTSTGPTASTNIINAPNQGGGDADLLATAQSVPALIGAGFSVASVQDAALIEFDFVPTSDTVEFNYVFGSDEYLTWINTAYNDVFGFYLSGPGINGTYSNNAINVATVPNTTPALPITISTIHPGLNGQYYNTGGALLAYNGYTDVMTAVLLVQACDTFHMKLGVADGTDGILDTGVFLEGSSFESVGLIVSPEPSYNPYGADTALYEGCGDVTIYFTRNDSVLAADSLSYEVYGQAEMGVDYTPIINSSGAPCIFNTITNHWECELYFGVGVQTDSITFDVLFDNLNEGIESLVIAITDSIQLSCYGGDTINLTIIDQPDLTINAFGDVTLDCNDGPALIGVQVSQGLPPFTFSWSNGVTDSTQNVLPTITSSYVVTVEDGCAQQTEVDFVNVGIFNVPWSSVKFGDNQTISCIDPPVTMGVSVLFNDAIWHGDISYQWSNGSTDSTITVFSTQNEVYTVTITRGCTQETVTHTFHLYTENDPVITDTKDIPASTFDCPGDTAFMKVSTSGGYEPYSFSWNTGATDSNAFANPIVTTTYYVTVNDACGLVDYVDSVTVYMPVAVSLQINGIVNDTVPCENVKVHFGPGVPSGGYGWGYAFSWDNFETQTDYIQDIIFEDTPYTLWLTDGCRVDTISKTVYGVIAEKNDLDLIVPNDTIICYGDEIMLTAQAIDGAGPYQYEWSNGASSASTRISPTEPTTYEMRMTDFCDTVIKKSVFVDVSQVVADFEWEYLNDYDVEFTNHSTGTTELIGFIWKSEKAGLESFEQSPILPYPDGEPYVTSLTTIDIIGCKDVDSVIVSPKFNLYIPSGFSPNNDGVNDVWSIESTGIRELRLEIYDRWGNTLYSTADKNFEWDAVYKGQRVPMGSYAYRLVLYTDQDEYQETRGVVNVLNDFSKRD